MGRLHPTPTPQALPSGQAGTSTLAPGVWKALDPEAFPVVHGQAEALTVGRSGQAQPSAPPLITSPHSPAWSQSAILYAFRHHRVRWGRGRVNHCLAHSECDHVCLGM